MTMRDLFYLMSKRVGLERLSAHLHRRRPIVLAFHGVTGETPGHLCNHEGKHLHLPLFKVFMEHIAVRYNAVPLARIVSWLTGDAELPDRSVVVTFDDGYRNVLTNAAPVLAEYGIPATVFVVTDFVKNQTMVWTDQVISALCATNKPRLRIERGNDTIEMPVSTAEEKIAADYRIRDLYKALDDNTRTGLLEQMFSQLAVDQSDMKNAWGDHAPLTPEDLGTLRELGIEVGSHSRSHKILARCDADVLEREFGESKRWIEDVTGAACDEFSYPNGRPGDFNDQTRQYAMAAGYACAATTLTQRVSQQHDRFEIPRFTIANNDTTLVEFGAKMSGYPNLLRTLRRGREGSV
jgi:peptidoglycan/xylan/chitin deacetylase (PgdA/CDA1 family)